MSTMLLRMLLTSVLACTTSARTLEETVKQLQTVALEALARKEKKGDVNKFRRKDASFLEVSQAQAKSSVRVTSDKSAIELSQHSLTSDDQKAIPKIIHFMFKEDPKQMHGNWPNLVWKMSYEAWKKYFPEPEYQYRFWTDDLIARFFNRHCHEHEDLFNSFNNEISRSDLCRYCILKELGGIYADLDYEPRENFYSDLPTGRVSLVESPYARETFQNSLMASPVGGKFEQYWSGVLSFAEQHQSIDAVKAAGPKLLDDYKESFDSSVVHKLPCGQFQLKVHVDSDEPKRECGQLTTQNAGKVKGIHWGTWSWFQTGDGENKNEDTARVFQMLHKDEKI